MQILSGAGIKAMLLQLSDEEIDEILPRNEPTRYTPHCIVDKAVYNEKILDVLNQSIVYDRAVFS